MKKLIFILVLSFICVPVYADKIFLQFGTGNQVDKSDSATLADIITKYGDLDWREFQYNPVTHEARHNGSTGLFEAYSLVDKKADQDAAKAIKDAEREVKKESLRLKLGLTKQEMDDLLEVVK